MTHDAGKPDEQVDRFVRSSFALMISNVVSAVLGVTFWAVAAHLYTSQQVGNGASAVAAMTLLGGIGILNLGTVFPRFLYPAGAKAGTVLRAGYAASLTVAVVAATLFLTLTGRHVFLSDGLPSQLFFLGAVVIWVLFTIEDAALVGFRKTFWVPVENIGFSIVKIALLPIFASLAPSAGVFNSWVVPVMVCVLVINAYLFFKVLPDHLRRSGGRGEIPSGRVIKNVVAGEYLGGLSFIAMTSLPALIIRSRLGPTSVAYFQTPWLAGTSFDMLLFSLATSLIVEASVRPGAAPDTVRRAVRLALFLLTPCLVIIEIGAPYFLEILGHKYAVHGTALLRLVALALPFMAVNVLYVTYARLARRVRRVLAIQVGISAMVLSLTVTFLSHFGIAGAGLAFLIGQAVASVLVFPSVFRQFRHPEMTPGFDSAAQMVARGAKQVNMGAESSTPPSGIEAPVDPSASRSDRARVARWPRPRGATSV